MDNIKVFINEDPSLFDAEIKIKINGLVPCESYTFHSQCYCNKHLFQCFSLYQANEVGTIDLSNCSSQGGFYIGVEPMGLFWAMQSYTAQQRPIRFIWRDVTTPSIIQIDVYSGWINTIKEIEKLSNKKIKSFKVTRLFMSPGVKRIQVHEENGLQGTLFLPPGKGPFPGLINMFGYVPGTFEYQASLFASHGFAALALSYFGIKGLPSLAFNVEMEYFEKAIQFLQKHECVDGGSGIGVVAISKSVQIAFAMADCLTGIKCVIGINGVPISAYSYCTYKDRQWDPVITGSLRKHIQFNKPVSFIGRYMGPITINDPKFKMSLFEFYKRPHVAYMFIAGLEDGNTSSDFFANAIERLLRSEDHPNYCILRYPGVGHVIEPPFFPLYTETYFKDLNCYIHFGGKSLPYSRAQIDSWKKQLEFLKKNLPSTISINSNL